MNPENTRSSASDVGQSRRDFLARSAVVAGAAAVLGSRAGTAPARANWAIPKAIPRPPLGPDDPIRIGIVGFGAPGMCAMGSGHVDAFLSIAKNKRANVKIAALCDVNALTLEWVKNRVAEGAGNGTPDTYAHHKELFARDDIHGVLLAVPEHWHAQMAIDAIAAGKDVYLEKPMTLNLADAVRLYEAQKANPDVRVQVGTQMINLPKYHEARKVIAEGGIGTPTFSQCSYCRNSRDGEWHYATEADQKLWPGKKWTPGENLDWDTWCGPLGKMPWDAKVYTQWRRYRKTSTGIIGDLLVHEMTPILHALGDENGWPVRVVATGGHLVDKEMENHDNVNLAIQFESGHQMFVCGSTCNEAGIEKMIRGHKANIYLNSRHCVVRPERVFADEIDEKTVECPDIGNDQDQHRLHWLKCIRERAQPLATVELGTKVMVIVDLATRSMWEGGAFTFDPKTMKSSRA